MTRRGGGGNDTCRPRTVYECHLQGGSMPRPGHPQTIRPLSRLLLISLKSLRLCWPGHTAPRLALAKQQG